jgi:hypothetical protein
MSKDKEQALEVEELQKKLGIEDQVFQGVLKQEKWPSGEKVTEAVFKKAVESFLISKDVKNDNSIRTIEEHCEELGIQAPVFQAVMMAEGWAACKKVPQAIFKQAVKTFLGSPMGGIASKGCA